MQADPKFVAGERAGRIFGGDKHYGRRCEVIFVYSLCRIVALAGLTIIVSCFVRILSVQDVLSEWSAQIDAQELALEHRGNDAAGDVLKSLCTYGKVIAKYEHLTGDWLYKNVLLGLFLLFPWCISISPLKRDVRDCSGVRPH